MTVSQRRSAWLTAVQRGRDWLAAQVDASPRFSNPDADLNWYCKVPWALAASGDRARALLVARQACSKFISPTFREPCETQWTNAPAYALGWLVSAAKVVEAHDVARDIYARLQQYTNRETHGLKSEPDWLDASIQGAQLHAAVAMNDLSTARAAGDLMIHFIDTQPRPSDGIFTHFHPAKGFDTNIPETERTGRRVFWRGAVKQPLANLGFVLQGLCRVTQATGDARYAHAAERLLDRIIANHHDDLLSHGQHHKIAHAAALLWRQTGRQDFLEIARLISDRVATGIHPDGRALSDLTYTDIAHQPPYNSIRMTCDSVAWLASVCDELATA